jgi:hypothetical protein
MRNDPNPQLTPEIKRIIEQEVIAAIRIERKVFMSVACIVLAVTLGVFGFSIRATSERIVEDLISSTAIKQIEMQAAESKDEIDKIRASVFSDQTSDLQWVDSLTKALERIEDENSSAITEVTDVFTKVTVLDAEVAALKEQTRKSDELLAAMGNDATKALAVPMLRKDLDTLKESVGTSSKTLLRCELYSTQRRRGYTILASGSLD